MIKLVTERSKSEYKNGEKVYEVNGLTTLTSLLTLIAKATSTALLPLRTGRTFLS